MLQKVDNPNIVSQIRDYPIGENAFVHCKTLYDRTRATPEAPGRLALFVHGGAAATNHTIIERPSRWLINRGCFDTILLPDRRGCGASSTLSQLPTFQEQAQDMQALLDVMRVPGPLTSIGISYGGPIALVHGYIDPRVERVVLWASSPTLNALALPLKLLANSGLMSRYLRRTYRREVGKLPPEYPDFDFAFDMANGKESWAAWRTALNHTPPERLESILLELEGTFNPPNRAIPDEVELDIPVLQVIGSRDETWGGGIPPAYKTRLRNLKQVILPGLGHKDAIWKADVFLEALAGLLQQEDIHPSAVTLA